VSNFSRKGFNATLFECIDSALSKLGETSKIALYYQIASNKGMDRKTLQSKPLDIVEGLREILGQAGSSFFEDLIVGEIETSFDLALRQGASLTEAVQEARKKFLLS
jgi:hypothetical protein